LERRLRANTVEARAARRARIILLAACPGSTGRRPVGPEAVAPQPDLVEVEDPPDAATRWTMTALGRTAWPGLQLHCIVDNLSAHGTHWSRSSSTGPRTVTSFLHNTPTHTSWLNQVEMWFSIMERRLIRHGEFDSVDELADRIVEFIIAYNRKAKPFRWIYDGRPLPGRVGHNDLRASPLGHWHRLARSVLRNARRCRGGP